MGISMNGDRTQGDRVSSTCTGSGPEPGFDSVKNNIHTGDVESSAEEANEDHVNLSIDAKDDCLEEPAATPTRSNMPIPGSPQRCQCTQAHSHAHGRSHRDTRYSTTTLVPVDVESRAPSPAGTRLGLPVQQIITCDVPRERANSGGVLSLCDCVGSIGQICSRRESTLAHGGSEMGRCGDIESDGWWEDDLGRGVFGDGDGENVLGDGGSWIRDERDDSSARYLYSQRSISPYNPTLRDAHGCCSLERTQAQSPLPPNPTLLHRPLSLFKPLNFLSHWNQTLNAHGLNPSLTLLNSGSVARDHLASERTFLAYVRTSVSVVGIGVALVQLLLMGVERSGTGDGPMLRAEGLKAYAPVLGGVIISFGVVLLLIGTAYFFHCIPHLSIPPLFSSITLTRFIEPLN
jgi:uncharacterized membrane protein YidH (DUF202 family)